MKLTWFIILFLSLAIPFETSVVYNDIVNVTMFLIIIFGFKNLNNIKRFFEVKTFRKVIVFLLFTLLISFSNLIIYGYETKLISYLSFVLLFISSAIIFYNSSNNNSFYYGYILGVLILIIIGYKNILLILNTESGILELTNYDGENSSFNSNTLAINFNFVAIFLFYYFFQTKNKALKYIFLILGALLLAISMQTTGSKKGLVLVVLIMLWLAYNIFKRNRDKKLSILISGIFITYSSIIYFNNYFQESITFKRFSNFLDPMSKDNTSGSSYHRKVLIDEGFQFWENRPAFGNGLGSFPSLTRTEWAYSHNNYIEILLSIGFIGFLLYYSIYFIIIKGYLQIALKNKSDLTTSLNLLLIFGVMITEFANVTYYSFTHAILLSYLLTSLVKKQNENTLLYR